MLAADYMVDVQTLTSSSIIIMVYFPVCKTILSTCSDRVPIWAYLGLSGAYLEYIWAYLGNLRLKGSMMGRLQQNHAAKGRFSGSGGIRAA